MNQGAASPWRSVLFLYAAQLLAMRSGMQYQMNGGAMMRLPE
jgi:hypothetical protein